MMKIFIDYSKILYIHNTCTYYIIHIIYTYISLHYCCCDRKYSLVRISLFYSQYVISAHLVKMPITPLHPYIILIYNPTIKCYPEKNGYSASSQGFFLRFSACSWRQGLLICFLNLNLLDSGKVVFLHL